MYYPKPRARSIPLGYKLLSIVLFAVLLVIGLVGIIMPIIPGLLFLFLALYVLTRISRRAAAYAHSQPWFNRHAGQMQAAGHLSIGSQIKLTLLVMARATVNGIQAAFDWLRSKAI